MKKLKKIKKKLDNRGSSIIMVIVAIAFVGIIVGSLLSAAGYAYKLKKQNLNAKDNLYYVEQAMQEIYAGVGSYAVEEMKEAYAYVLENMVEYDLTTGAYVTWSDEKANSEFRAKFGEYLKNSDYFSHGTDYLAEALQSYISNDTVDLDNGKLSFEMNYVDFDHDGIKNDFDSITIKNVTLTREQAYSQSSGGGTYTQTISTDIVISAPDFQVSFNNLNADYSEIFNYALVGDMGIEIDLASNTPLNIIGNIYAAADYYNKSYNFEDEFEDEIEYSKNIADTTYSYTLGAVTSKVPNATSSNGYVNDYAKDAEGKGLPFDGENEHSMYSGIYISNSEVSIMADTIIVPGTIAVMNSSELSVYGSSGVTPEVWADNLVFGGSSKADSNGNYTGSEGYFRANLYVRDDTELNAKGSSFTLSGSYYGYGNSSSKDSRVFVPTVTSSNFQVPIYSTDENGNLVASYENRGHYNSSSIVINGESSTLDLSKTETLYLAGRAYIELSKDVESSISEDDVYSETYVYQPTSTVNNETVFVRDYKTAESISLKSNQLMYNVSNLGAYNSLDIAGTKYDAVKVGTNYSSDEEAYIYGNRGFFADFFPVELFGNNVLVIKQEVDGKTVYYIDFETAYDVISAAKADTSYTKYSAIQVTAATNAFSKLEQTMKDELNINYDINSQADYMEAFVLLYENDVKNNTYSELTDVVEYDGYDQGTVALGLITNVYSSGAITTRSATEFNIVTNSGQSDLEALFTTNEYSSNYTYSASDNNVGALELAFNISKDYEIEYNYMKWNLAHYYGADNEKTYVNDILSLYGEDSITPINKYLVLNNISDAKTLNGVETLSGYKVWISNDDVTITGDDVIEGIVITKGDVVFGSDVVEFTGLIVAGGKIYINGNLSKLSASPSSCRGVLRDCITSGDTTSLYILKVFKEYENYSTDENPGSGELGDVTSSKSIDAIDYTEIVTTTNWMKNVGGAYDGE